MLRAERISHRYGRTEVLHDVSFDIPQGQRIGLHGPSGCGKSTLLRVLALLEAPTSGRVMLDGEHVRGSGTKLPATTRRRVQLLWQSPRLATDPRQRLDTIIGEAVGLAGDDPTGPRVNELAEAVGLTPDLLVRSPHEVSDGQLQRACLARALAVRPDVLLCDELGSMLDVSTQASLLRVIEREQHTRGMAVLLVSHDRALLDHWCDPVLAMHAGTIRPNAHQRPDYPAPETATG
jgi:peptide/nickel transport system ATP-binding protein